MTYVLISLPFLLLAGVLWAVRRRTVPGQWTVTLIVMAVLLVLTAVFDNFMIGAGFVGYGDSQRLGVQVGLAPIEDFFYPVFAALMVAALWTGKGSR